MKFSIALTLIITIAVFSFVSGYSISAHNKLNPSHNMASTANASNAGTANAAESPSAASGGYGSPDSEKAGGNASPSGYGAPSPGYGQ